MKTSQFAALLILAAQVPTAFAGLREDAPSPNDFALPSAALSRGDYLLAEAAYRQLTVRFPRLPRAWQALGNSLDAQKRFSEADPAYTRAAELYREHVRIYPHDAKAHYQLYMSLSCSSQSKEAKAALSEGLRLNPSDPSLLELQKRFQP